jgi:hypothetical protein
MKIKKSINNTDKNKKDIDNNIKKSKNIKKIQENNSNYNSNYNNNNNSAKKPQAKKELFLINIPNIETRIDKNLFYNEKEIWLTTEKLKKLPMGK